MTPQGASRDVLESRFSLSRGPEVQLPRPRCPAPQRSLGLSPKQEPSGEALGVLSTAPGPARGTPLTVRAGGWEGTLEGGLQAGVPSEPRQPSACPARAGGPAPGLCVRGERGQRGPALPAPRPYPSRQDLLRRLEGRW